MIASDAAGLQRDSLAEDGSSEADKHDCSCSCSVRDLDPKQPSTQKFHSFLADQNRTMARKKGTERGGFRLSEPFTLVMRIQADALMKTISQADANAFRTQVWNLWTNYLAITGEFGPKAWALAFQRVAESLGKQHASYLLTPTSGTHNLEERTSACGARRAQELILAALPFAGWGQFCDFLGEISTGSEASSSHPSRILPVFEQDDDETIIVARKKGVREVSIVDRMGQEEKEDMDETRTRQQKRNEELNVEEDVESTGYIESSLPDLDPEAKSWLRLSQKQKEFVQYFQNAASLDDVEDLWMDLLLDMFHCPERYGATRMHTEIRPGLSPVACAAAALNSSPFAFLEFGLFQVLRRSRPPKHSLMTSITLRLADMLAVSHRPLLPLSWLVHQWLLTLGLPREAHQIASRLIGRLGAVVRRAAQVRDDRDLLLCLPNQRYLRGEVFAAAVAVVIARLLFKLDGSFEVSWLLPFCPNLRRTAVAAVYHRGKRAPRHFDWAEWAAWLEARSSNRLGGSFAQSRTDHDTVSSSSSCSTAIDPPLQSAFRMSDLLPIESATEFLGPAEFNLTQDVGWFERSDSRRPFSEVGPSPSHPLCQLLWVPLNGLRISSVIVQ
ncbi:unnamed protein product [Schistocephalus solidus]|uniref:DUF3437 domain-containing protein n=1 Tax=Schistocephalus solidus TaxID=70667 RepID=A0A183T8J0_SCHSO|nr:unnamed protein product [Schistocephalus solidus]